MNRILILEFLMLGLSVSLPAQTWGQGHAFAGFEGPGDGHRGRVLSAGGGYDAFVSRGLAASADLGYVSLREVYGAPAFGVLSAGPSYHFTNWRRTRRLVPYITGGYGLVFDSDSPHTVYYGFGATYWFHRHFGARGEFRDYQTRYGRFMSTVRFSLSFR